MAYNFTGDFTVGTSRAETFAVLSETGRFAPLMPTYRSHTLRDDGSADVEVSVGVGKVRGTGRVNLLLEESVAPERARYLGKGEVMGGAFNLKAGFTLEELGPSRTKVNWEGELAIFGKLVSLAGGLVKLVVDGTVSNYRLYFPDATPQYAAFSGFVSGFTAKEPMDDALTADVTIKIAGAVTWT